MELISYFAKYSGNSRRTEAGTFPVREENLTVPGVAGTVGSEVVCKADHVAFPTMPSAVRPLALCHALTAASVPGPNEPSALIFRRV